MSHRSRSSSPAPTLRPVSAKQKAARARCEAMVHHARTQVLDVGVDRFSVNEVLRLSGGSKATLAKYFGGRTGLIAAAIRSGAEAAISDLQLDADDVRALPLAQALGRALSGVLHFYLTRGALALYRAVISAAAASPGAADAFYAQGHRCVVEAVARLLAERQPREVRRDLDCEDAADQLLHAIRAGIYEQTLIGLIAEPDPGPIDDLIDRRIAATLALVLPGLAPPQA